VAAQYAAQAQHLRALDGLSVSVVLVDDVPAGRLVLARRGGDVHVADIALLPRFRGAGHGTALLRRVMAEADRVTLTVRRDSRALALYARLGFRAAGGTDTDVRLEWRQEKTAS
jgi:ribosomal protein S18 acetylase RimI-like enzyme